MTIAAILESKGDTVIDIAGEVPVSAAVALLAEKRIGALPVTAGGKVIGIFSERDVIYGLARDGAALLQRPVREVMTSPAHMVTPDVPILSALGLMTQRRVRHLPVVDGETLIGLVSIGDLVKLRIDRIEADAAAMRAYIQAT